MCILYVNRRTKRRSAVNLSKREP